MRKNSWIQHNGMIDHGTCALIAIGDELLLGKIQDTNSAFLAQLLSDAGFALHSMAIIGDNEAQIVAALQALSASVDLIIITGGLGPTADDRTRHALAGFMDAALCENKSAWQQIEGFYKKHWPNKEIPPSNKRQALFPRGAKVLRNDRGTAPGMLARVGTTSIVCLPGVPHEMRAMAQRFVAKITDIFPDLTVPVLEEIHFAGLGESSAQDRLGDLLLGDSGAKADRGLQVGICAHEGGHITIRVRGSATAVKRRCAAIRRCLKAFLLPYGSLAQSIVQRLSKVGKTVTTAESCTCGQIVAAIGAVPGASAILHEALITYHNDAKIQHLAVTPDLIKNHGVVSEAVVRAMAAGALRRTGADYAIVSSGIAGPGGGSVEKPVGTVWIAVASRQQTLAQRLLVRGDRVRIQQRAAAEALRLLWQSLVDEKK